MVPQAIGAIRSNPSSPHDDPVRLPPAVAGIPSPYREAVLQPADARYDDVIIAAFRLVYGAGESAVHLDESSHKSDLDVKTPPWLVDWPSTRNTPMSFGIARPR